MSISTVWSIDVGKSSLKAVKISREQTSLEILAVDKIDFEANDSGVDSIGQAKEALRTFAARNTIDCPVAVLHPSRSAFSRFIQLPPVDPKKLEEMIGYEAQQQIPFPIDEVIWDHHVSDGDDESMEKEVGIFAVRKEAISDFMLDYDEFPMELITVGYIGLLNYVLFDLRPNKPVVVLDMGSDHTDLLIVDGTRFWFRSLPSAGKDFTQALQEKFKLDYLQAEELKTEGAKSEHAPKIFQVVQPLIRDLVNEINRSIGFYKSQAGEVKFEDLFLFGNGSKLLGLKKSLEEHLKFRVHVAKGFHRLRVNRESNVALLQNDFPAFSSCVGAGIQALGEGDCEVNLLPQEQQEALEFKKKQKTVLLAAAALYILPIWLFVSFSGKISSANSVLEKTAVVDELKKTKRDISKIDGARTDEVKAAEELLWAPLAQRKESYDAFQAAQEIFASFPNDRVVPHRAILADNRTSGVGELTTEQEELNSQKWWMTMLDLERIRVDQAGNPAREARRGREDDTVSFEATRVTLGCVRYQFDNQAQNTNEVRSQVHAKVLAYLQSRFENYPAELVKLEVAPQAPEQIFTRHEELRRSGRRDRDQVGAGGTFFEFNVSWIQPPPPPVEPEEEE